MLTEAGGGVLLRITWQEKGLRPPLAILSIALLQGLLSACMFTAGVPLLPMCCISDAAVGLFYT